MTSEIWPRTSFPEIKGMPRPESAGSIFPYGPACPAEESKRGLLSEWILLDPPGSLHRRETSSWPRMPSVAWGRRLRWDSHSSRIANPMPIVLNSPGASTSTLRNLKLATEFGHRYNACRYRIADFKQVLVSGNQEIRMSGQRRGQQMCVFRVP